MRIEIDYLFLLSLFICLVIVWGFLKRIISNKLFKIIFSLNVALIIPSFIPGHGEIIMLIPTAALYKVSSYEVKFIGVIFTVINYVIVWHILYKVARLFKDKI